MGIASNEVLAYCGSCKMDLTAVIVAKVGAKIAKVQCKTCKKEHGFKQPKGVTEPGATPAKTTTRKRTVSSSGDGAHEVKTVSVESEWNRLMQEATAASRVKYSPKAQLKLGDVVVHPTFGEGVVTRIGHPDKAEIIFKTDVKLLIHSRL